VMCGSDRPDGGRAATDPGLVRFRVCQAWGVLVPDGRHAHHYLVCPPFSPSGLRVGTDRTVDFGLDLFFAASH